MGMEGAAEKQITVRLGSSQSPPLNFPGQILGPLECPIMRHTCLTH